MIKDARQLKFKIQQLTKGDSQKSQIYLRNFFMERFLERMSASSYRDKFILKGGMLVASLVGFDLRSTMDIDSSVKNLTLNEAEATEAINKIMKIPLDDSVNFVILKNSPIMGEHDYQFMFENRSIKLLTYNLETMLAEKIETMIARGIANTRMRDFYDVFILTRFENFDLSILKEAILNTSKMRGTESLLSNHSQIMRDITGSQVMDKAWDNLKKQSYFVGDLSWKEVIGECFHLVEKVLK